MRLLLRGLVGFALGFALWAGLTEPYNRLVAASAEGVMWLFEDPNRTELRPDGRQVVIYRSDVPAGSKRPGVPLYDLTFNVILLTVLFALDRRPFSDRNVGMVLLSLLILFSTHVLALIAWVQDLYASAFGGAISERYSDLERSVWTNAILFYRLVGQFAIPLILRWSLTPEGGDADPAPPVAPGAKTRTRRRT
ncbi:MAG TPA: hypothetical protein VMS56_01975 [Thermoanaerobaculia bacterium]|nr:hypothetical protein [Thermoanaerobaculia bacterium]